MQINIRPLFLALATIILFMAGCQQEVVEITNPQDNTIISVDSSVVNLIQRTSMRDGSADNIIDNSSCTTLVLPITVIANGQEVIINTEEDFKLVERIFDASDTDQDNVEMVFPITVILADHTEVTLNSMDEFEKLISDCVEGGSDDDIECLDFVYPLTISVYDATNQVSEVVTINNDEELYELFESLEQDDLISFSFPLALMLADGTVVEVNDNDELENLIKEVADDCDEDDDNDYEDDDVDDADLVAVLLDGEWAITYFFDEADNSAEFTDFVFTFLEDGTAQSTDGNVTIEGTWQTYGDIGELELAFDFNSASPFNKIEMDWVVLEFETNKMEMGDSGEKDDAEKFLTFERPTDNGGGGEPSLTEIISVGNWKVINYTNSGTDETTNYTAFTFTFNAGGTAVAASDTETINGTWEEINDSGTLKLVLDFGGAVPLNEFAEDWEVVSFSNANIELKDIHEDNTTDTLVFEKI